MPRRRPRQVLARRSGESEGRRRGADCAPGFTLIETLVVLVIAAAITAILMFAFDRVLDIRLRLAAFLEGTDVPTLVAGWFRDSADGLVADVKGGRNRFAGNARGFTGLSLAPIDGKPGVPTRISWQLQFNAASDRTYLRYREGAGDRLTIASWPGNLGSLRYCGADLVCHPHWPASDKASELPALIVLEAVKGTAFWPILAAPRSGRNPLPKTPNFRTAQQ